MLSLNKQPAHPFDGQAMSPCQGGTQDTQVEHVLDLRPEPATCVPDHGWSEEEIVHLHALLLMEIRSLPDPSTPLEEKLDTLRWIFGEPVKQTQPFSFEWCLRVVGCSPLSPFPFCGLVSPEDIRQHVAHHVKRWLRSTLERYPQWVRDAVSVHPEWVARQLERNAQWLNEQVRKQRAQPELFDREGQP